MSILSMSITGGVMILVVVLIRALLLERLPKRTFLVLWGLVMLRLLVPFQVSSKASIYNLVPSNNQVLTPMLPAINTTAPILDTPYIPRTLNSTVNNISPITVVWIAGILLTLLCTTFVYVRSMRNMKTSLPCENTFVENWLQSIPLKRKIQVRVFDRIKTPLTYGIIHPVILLPKNMDYSNEHQLLAILTHEYIHIQRFDNLKKLMIVLTLSIHWFNLLVWVMFVLCNRDIELACDEKVLLDLGNDTRATYALTLVELSERSNVFSLTSGFSKNALEERIKAIMKHKKMTAFTVAIMLVLIVGVTTVFATSEKLQPNQLSTEMGTSKEISSTKIHNNMGNTVLVTEKSKIFRVTVNAGSVILMPSKTESLSMEYDKSIYNVKESFQGVTTTTEVSLIKPIDNLAGKDVVIYLPADYSDVAVINKAMFIATDISANFDVEDFGMATLAFENIFPENLNVHTKENAMTNIITPENDTNYSINMKKSPSAMVNISSMGSGVKSNSFSNTLGSGEKRYELNIDENAMLSFVGWDNDESYDFDTP